MKRIDFNQTGGFPVTTQTLEDLQYPGDILQRVAAMCGNFAIISGCEAGQTSVTDGMVFINGELLEFKSAIPQTNVIIKEETTSAQFENGQTKPIIKYRYATFGSGQVQFPWASFKRVTNLSTTEERLAKMEKILKPIVEGNCPILFLKPANEIPPGYTEWIDGAGFNLIGRKEGDPDFGVLGATGGGKTITIEKTHLPAIRLGTGIYNQGGRLSDDSGPMDNIGFSANGSEVKTELLGSATPIKTLDPYRIVNYIIYVG